MTRVFGLTQSPPLSPSRDRVRLVAEKIDRLLAARLGEALLRRFHAVPLESGPAGVRFACSDPSQGPALSQATGLAIEPFLASATEIDAALDVTFGLSASPMADAAVYKTLRCRGLLTTDREHELASLGQDSRGVPGWSLVRLGILSEAQLAEALALTFHMPHVRLERWPLSPLLYRLVDGLPGLTAPVVPLAVVERTLVLAIANPGDWEAVRRVEKSTGYAVRAVIAEASRLERRVGELRSLRAQSHNELEELLVAHGVTSPGRIALAKEVAWHTGEPLSDVLVRTGACAASDIEALASRVRDMPAADLARLGDPDPAMVSLIPQPLAERLQSVPYMRTGDTIHIAVAKPGYAWIAEFVAHITGLDAVAETAPPHPIFNAVRRGLFRSSIIFAGDREGAWDGEPDDENLPLLRALLVRSGFATDAQFAAIGPGDGGIAARVRELVASGNAGETDITEIVAVAYDMPWIDRLGLQPSPAALRDFVYSPERNARAVPLFAFGRQATVAVEDGSLPALRSLEAELGMTVTPVLASADALKRAGEFVNHLRPETIPPMFWQFGQFLRDRRQRTAAELLRFLRRTVGEGAPADLALIEERLASPEEAPQVLAEFLQAPLVELRVSQGTGRATAAGPGRERSRFATEVDVALAKLVPFERAEVLAAVPVRRESRGIVVAFADPLDLNARSELGSLLRAPIVTAVAARAQVLDAIRKVHGRQPLGDRLLAAGLISHEQYVAALHLHQRTGVRLGQALLALGYIDEERLMVEVAAQYGFPFQRLSDAHLDERATALVTEPFARRQRLLPVAVRGGQVVAATDEPGNTAALAELTARTGKPVAVVVTTKGDFDSALEATYRDHYETLSVHGLMAGHAGYSAHGLIRPRGIAIGVFMLGAVGTAFVMQPLPVLASILLLVAALFAGYHLVVLALTVLGLRRSDEGAGAGEEPVSARDLPVFTILVPVSNGERLRERLSAGIERVDYPATKLDVKLLVREDDTSALDDLRGMRLPVHYDLVIVPKGGPRTRSYLLNYGLLHARGDLVTAIDLDEQPDASQLIKAAAALKAAGDGPICAIAEHRVEGAPGGLLRWAALDGRVWHRAFGRLLTGAPVPQELRRATLHTRTSDLLGMGGYDACSFAEDGGIGLRLAEAGVRVQRIDSRTHGPVNVTLTGWLGSETRRWRGSIQTLLVQLRRPGQLWRRSAISTSVLLQLSSTVRYLAALGTLPLAAASGLWLISRSGVADPPVNEGVLALCASGFAAGLLAHVIACGLLSLAGNTRASALDAVTSPAYLLLDGSCAWAASVAILSSGSTWSGAKCASTDMRSGEREVVHLRGLEA